MATREKNTNKSVTFTPEDPDKALIEAVEKELAKQEYKNFSELCKQALRQFLLSEPAQSLPSSEQHLEFAAIEQKIMDRVSSRLELLENQLSQVTQQLQNLEAKVNQSSPSAPKAATPPPAQELDPVLSRLSHLFEDF